MNLIIIDQTATPFRDSEVEAFASKFIEDARASGGKTEVRICQELAFLALRVSLAQNRDVEASVQLPDGTLLPVGNNGYFAYWDDFNSYLGDHHTKLLDSLLFLQHQAALAKKDETPA